MIKYTDKQLLERELIEKFKTTFYKKLGYYPIVTTQVINDEDIITLMSLNELEQYFIKFFPHKFGKIQTLRSKPRFRELIDLRIIFTQIARTMNYTYYNIGQYLGGRHHTTVLNYSVLFRNLMENNPPFRLLYHKIFKHIKQKTNESSVMVNLDQVFSEPQSDILS